MTVMLIILIQIICLFLAFYLGMRTCALFFLPYGTLNYLKNVDIEHANQRMLHKAVRVINRFTERYYEHTKFAREADVVLADLQKKIETHMQKDKNQETNNA